MDYSEKYNVKRATSISDTSILYGEMSKGKMWLVGFSGLLVIVGSVVGMISLYGSLPL